MIWLSGSKGGSAWLGRSAIGSIEVDWTSISLD